MRFIVRKEDGFGFLTFKATAANKGPTSCHQLDDDPRKVRSELSFFVGYFGFKLQSKLKPTNGY